jgi:hypothetical protein
MGVVLAAGAAADAATLSGRVTDARSGQPLAKVGVQCSASGRSVTRATRTSSDGLYRFDGLDAGSYTVWASPERAYRRALAAGVEVAAEQTTELDLQLDAAYAVNDDSWLSGYRTYAQTLVATGTSITTVAVKVFSHDERITATIREGGPKGRQVGPSRETTERFGGEGGATISWSAGEVPTRPGGRYCAVLTSDTDEPWAVAVDGQGDTHPLGEAWLDGVRQPATDLGIRIIADDDNFSTDYAFAPGLHAVRVRSAGQTFRATSANALYASLPAEAIGGRTFYLRVSLHEAATLEQIGPSKRFSPWECSGVGWAPGEAPLTPGKEYRLHVERVGGGLFLVRMEPDGYRLGRAVLNGKPAPERDLAAVIMGQAAEAQLAALIAPPGGRPVALDNPSFERRLVGWRETAQLGAVVGAENGYAPRWGGHMYGWTRRGEGEGSKMTVHREVSVRRGAWYRWSGWLLTDHIGGRSSDVHIRLVANPHGGDTFDDKSGTLRSQWYCTEGRWVRGELVFQARADEIVVGAELEQRWSQAKNSLYVDGFALAEVPAPAGKEGR